MAALEQHTALALSSLRRVVSEARTDQSAGHVKPMGRCCHPTPILITHSYILPSYSFLSTTLVSHFLILCTHFYLPRVSRQQLPEGDGLGQLFVFVGLCQVGGSMSSDPDTTSCARVYSPETLALCAWAQPLVLPVGPDGDGGVFGERIFHNNTMATANTTAAPSDKPKKEN